jgi:hypothetical protein
MRRHHRARLFRYPVVLGSCSGAHTLSFALGNLTHKRASSANGDLEVPFRICLAKRLSLSVQIKPSRERSLDRAHLYCQMAPSAIRWIKQGLEVLGRDEKWNFAPRVRYEIDAHKGLLWTRLKATSRLQLLKALVYEAFRDARFKFRRCRRCQRGFVPIRRQAYCSPRCSQAARTEKWRKAHPEKNRAIRRAQYQKSIAAKLKLSATAAVKIASTGSV